MANQGYASKENRADSQKIFSGNKPSAKSLPKADNLKVFNGKSDTAGPMQHKAMKPTAPRFKD